MNSFKFKNKEQHFFFRSLQSPTKDEKYKFIRQYPSKKPQQHMKLQKSYRQSNNFVRRPRYDTLQNNSGRNQNIKSLSLRRKSKEIHNDNEKSTLFKRPINSNKKTLKTSLDGSKKSLSPQRESSKKCILIKKLTILDSQRKFTQTKDTNQIRMKQHLAYDDNTINSNRNSKCKNKFRVNSTFSKVNSIQILNQTREQSSPKTLTTSKKKNSMKKKLSVQNVEVIKVLVKSEQYKQALLMTKKLLSETHDKNNIEALQLYATCLYNLQEYLEVTKTTQKIIKICDKCSSEIYVMSCLSHAKLKNYEKSLQIISKGSTIFPQNSEIFFYKGKILYHLKKYKLAEEFFNSSYLIRPLPEILICLADCYRKTNNMQDQLNTLEKILSQKNVYLMTDHETLFIRKLKIMFQLSLYEEVIKQVQSSQKLLKSLKSPQIKAEIEYIDAFCKYKLYFTENSYQKFQDCIVSEYFYAQSLKMLIVLQIKSRNFYEASHLCNQVFRKQFKIKSDQIFDILTTFVEGSIDLVRRNFKEGLECLSKVQLSLENNEFKNYNSQKQWKKYENAQNYEAFKTVKNLVHQFMSYGLFCIGEYKFCQAAIVKQKQIFNEAKYQQILDYNDKLCSAILSFREKNYRNTMDFLVEAGNIYPERLQVFFYRSVVLIQMLLMTIQSSDKDQNSISDQCQRMTSSIHENFRQALQRVSTTANNTHATILYYKSLFHSYLKEWKEALVSIEECIARSDQNYWRYYYCKGMILACVNNFDDAIAELNVAINLSQGQRPECFLLRSMCLQIQGKGNDAFLDLQHYIGLKPDDDEVHKYAGQILFENGAFEDALIAFEHRQITETSENFDIFLTLAKTLFLTGKFNQAQQKMFLAAKLNQDQIEVLFDAKVIRFAGLLIQQIKSNTLIQNHQKITVELEQLFSNVKGTKKTGKIFKEADFYLFHALIGIFCGDFTKTILNFKKHLVQKRKVIILDISSEVNDKKIYRNTVEEELDKTPNEVKIYINQMKYNLVVCYLMGGDIENAKNMVKQIKVDEKESFYSSFVKFKTAIQSESFDFKKQQILPNKNKLSQFLPSLSFNLTQKNIKIKLSLCIPFPKVEPPDIFPSFDIKLLKTLSIFGIQGKPEAPWIVKEDNVIKFTQKISYASQLDFNDSQESSSTTVIIDLENSRFQSKNKIQKTQQDKSSLFSRRTLKKKNSVK